MSKELFKTTIDLDLKLKPSFKRKGSIKKALGSYLGEVAESPVEALTQGFEDLRGLIQKQPDLLYALSVYASEGVNKNKDAFLRSILTRIYQTPRHKFVDYEHDVTAEDESSNPENYHVVGHIYDSQLALQRTGEKIPDYDVFLAEDGRWFDRDSKWRNEPLDILVAWVLYKFEYPELADEIMGMTWENPGSFGVSMEVLFSDYKFRVGGIFDPTEDFEFDGNTTGATEVRKGDPLADFFQKEWNSGKNRMYKGLPVIRILGGDIFFSGMAITKNRANARSWNISVASVADDFIKANKEDKKDLFKLIEAVANKSKDFDISQCKIVNGKPDCECLQKAVSSEIQDIEKEITQLITTLGKITGKEIPVSEKQKTHSKSCPFCGQEKILANWIDIEIDEQHVSEHLESIKLEITEANNLLTSVGSVNGPSSDQILKTINRIQTLLESLNFH